MREIEALGRIIVAWGVVLFGRVLSGKGVTISGLLPWSSAWLGMVFGDGFDVGLGLGVDLALSLLEWTCDLDASKVGKLVGAKAAGGLDIAALGRAAVTTGSKDCVVVAGDGLIRPDTLVNAWKGSHPINCD